MRSAVAVVVAPEGVGRTSAKSMEVGREMPTVGVAAWVEMPELSSVAKASGWEAAGANSIDAKISKNAALEPANPE